MKITYNEKSKKWLVNVPFTHVDQIRNAPSRRFDTKSKHWILPVNRANLNFLKAIDGAEWTEDARFAATNFEGVLTSPRIMPFPRDYNFGEYGPEDYQVGFLDFSWANHAVNFVGAMGIGKTFSSIHLAVARWQVGQIGLVMVICPANLRKNWVREFGLFAPDNFVSCIHTNGSSEYRDFLRLKTNKLKILLVSVEGLGISQGLFEDAAKFFTEGEGGKMCICDESSRIKNPKANRSERAALLAHAADFRLTLNGTPIANSVMDLFSQYEFLDPNIIGCGDWFTYRTRYCVMGGYEGKQIIGNQNMDELLSLIKPYTYEIGKDVLKLKPKKPKQIDVELTPEQKRAIASLKQWDQDFVDQHGVIKVENVLERALRALQIVGGWIPTMNEDGSTKLTPFEKNPKMKALLEVIEDHPTEKFIIWSGYRHEIEAIAQALQAKYGPDSTMEYHGGINDDVKEEAHLAFQKGSTSVARFFVGNPSAGGLGLNLVAATVMVYYSNTYSYIYRAQSEDRFHRKGQVNEVTVVDLVSDSAIDQAMKAAQEHKLSLDVWLKENMNHPLVEALLKV